MKINEKTMGRYVQIPKLVNAMYVEKAKTNTP